MEASHFGNAPAADRDRLDIVGYLPLELLIQIVEYPDQADIVRFQKVQQCQRFDTQ